MTERWLEPDLQKITSRYLKASREIQTRLRELLEDHHTRSTESVELEPQQFDFIWESEGELGKIKPGPFIDPNSGGEHSRAELEEELSHFNRSFLSLFEPLFKYQNYALAEKIEPGGEVNQKNNVEARRPLWLAVLEVEEKKLNYSLFATEGSKNTCELGEPRNLFRAHRMYDDVDKERDLIDLSHLYTEGIYGEEDVRGGYLPSIVAVVEGSTINGECGGENTYEVWKRRCMEIGLNFNFIGIKRRLVNKIDETIWNNIREEINEKEIRRLIKKVKKIISEQERGSSYSIEDDVIFESGEWGHTWFKNVWDKKREGVLLYFIWLRCLALAAEKDSVTNLREASNFKAYLYFPVPDISGDYVHTITSAFAGWPDPEWILMVQQQAPKLFQRSGLKLARKQAKAFGHEVYDTTQWVVRGLRQNKDLWKSIPILLRQGLMAVRLIISRVSGFSINFRSEFPGLSDNPIEDYLRLSTMVALQRLGRRAESGIRRKARQLRMEEAVVEVLDFTNLSIQNRPPKNEPTIRSQVFGVMFYRCLWQAIYHSIVCEHNDNENYKRPVIEFETDNEKISVEIRNPGSTDKKGSIVTPTDESEIRNLGDDLGAKKVYGPRYSSEKNLWETGFTFRKIR